MEISIGVLGHRGGAKRRCRAERSRLRRSGHPTTRPLFAGRGNFLEYRQGEVRLSPVLPAKGLKARCVLGELAVAYVRRGPPGRMGRTTVLRILHGSKHPVLGASARRPILVLHAATSDGTFGEFTFHALG